MNQQILRYLKLIFILPLVGSSLVACQPTENTTNRLQQLINTVVSKPEFRSTSYSVTVRNLSKNSDIVRINSGKGLSPASTIKLLTTALLLDTLKADYCFETKFYLNGKLSKEGAFKGDIIIKGAGDPTLGSQRFKKHYGSNVFAAVCDSLTQMGVKSITGQFIADLRFMEGIKAHPNWNWADVGNYYGAGPEALTYHDNEFDIVFSTGAKQGDATNIKRLDPNVDVHIENHVFSSRVNSDRAYVYGDPYTNFRTVFGTLPINKSNFSVRASLPNPEKLLFSDFEASLAESGIKCKLVFKQLDKASDYAESECFASIFSPALSEIIRVTNHRSVNLYAEHLLRKLGHVYKNSTLLDSSLLAARNCAKHIFTDTLGFEQIDGSGLAASNSITTMQLVELLDYMWQYSPEKKTFFNSLPQAGKSGTMSRFKDSKLIAADLRAKSGTLSGTIAYSGYIKNRSGEQLAFALIFNKYDMQYKVLRKHITEIFRLMAVY